MNDLQTKSKSGPIAVLKDSLEAKVATLEKVLPEPMRTQAERFLARAVLTVMNGSPQLQKCTTQSIVMAVLRAGEFGLAIDGRLAHAIPYGDKAQFQPDYKGIIAVAKRLGLLQDAWARIVYLGDEFQISEENGVTNYRHIPNYADRGEPYLVFAVATHPEGWYRVDVMTIGEIDAVRKTSKAANNGPWVSWYSEMAKKTVLKRLLKTFAEDPGMATQLHDLIEEDNREYELEPKRSRKSAPISKPLEIADTFDEPEVEPEPPKEKPAPKKRKPKAATTMEWDTGLSEALLECETADECKQLLLERDELCKDDDERGILESSVQIRIKQLAATKGQLFDTHKQGD